ncbi:hypothetical protein PIROE2DRAFT_16554 [Piromyces sp. E2]|nr:hypothetical protein PIROE2DRAFT_16554 [Piromyces sp. E2]|eukprot:OUM58230.1 hypothetical protein PIROE2DRAFT_16554 [Piromyces sp. E2]
MALLEKLNYFYPNTLWIVALRWNIKSVPKRDIMEFIRERIEERGENHEVVTPEKSPNYPFYINWMLNDYNDINLISPEDCLINEVIDIDFKEDSISIVNKLIKALNLQPKSPEDIENAYNQARTIKITEEKRKANSNNQVSPIEWGLRIKYINGRDIAQESLKNFADQNNNYSVELEQVQSIINKSNFLQREHVKIANKKDGNEIIKYYDNLIGPSNQIDNFNNPELEAFLQASSIVWTSNMVFLPIDIIESDKVMKKTTNNNNKNQDYYIIIAYNGNDKKMNCLEILNKINQYYERNPDFKPSPLTTDTIPVIDQSYVIDETNRDKEDEIVHPNTLIQLLLPSLKDTSFIKPIKMVDGPDWKQLFFEPFKLKAYFTKFYY